MIRRRLGEVGVGGLSLAALLVVAAGSFGAGEAGRPAAHDAPSVVATSGIGPRARECPPIRVPDPAESPDVVQGGCVLHARSPKLAIEVVTALGELRFADCAIHYTLHVDGRGRTVLADIGFKGFSPCNDIYSCFTESDILPLEGRIVPAPDGGWRHVVDGCFDNCMGRFEGTLTTSLTRDRRGWREDAGGALVGDSGLQFDGGWRLRAGSGPQLRLARSVG